MSDGLVVMYMRTIDTAEQDVSRKVNDFCIEFKRSATFQYSSIVNWYLSIKNYLIMARVLYQINEHLPNESKIEENHRPTHTNARAYIQFEIENNIRMHLQPWKIQWQQRGTVAAARWPLLQIYNKRRFTATNELCTPQF